MIIRREVRRAGSRHRCDCGLAIERGERYDYEFGLLDGETYTVKQSIEHVHSFEREDAHLQEELCDEQ